MRLPALVGKGNANILIDYGDPTYLYRCCIKYPNSIAQNNSYTLENLSFIKQMVLPLLGEFICPMELVTVDLQVIYAVYKNYVSDPGLENDTKVICLKIPNLKPAQIYTNELQTDHLTKVYMNSAETSVILEIKSKWLHNPMEFCRNCTDNLRKNRCIDYCYAEIVSGKCQPDTTLDDCSKQTLPTMFLDDLGQYFKCDNNVLRILLNAQAKLHRDQKLSSIKSIDDVDIQFQTLMTLRDVTCFLKWTCTADPSNRFEANIVDVDLKDPSKWKHWTKTHLDLSRHPERISHC